MYVYMYSHEKCVKGFSCVESKNKFAIVTSFSVFFGKIGQYGGTATVATE